MNLNTCETIFFSDEYIFQSNGAANMHDAGVRDLDSPHPIEKVPAPSKTLTAWSRMYEADIIRPYFFSLPTVK